MAIAMASEIGQDVFAISVNQCRRDAYFLELGAAMATECNTTWIAERDFGWRGLMVECLDRWVHEYKAVRKSDFAIADATTLDYATYFKEHSYPADMAYLQMDLEPMDRSTLNALEHLEKTIFPNYRFAAVCFEHDAYKGDEYNTRVVSREKMTHNGYFLLFPDIRQQYGWIFEDWYVHPDLVNMDVLLSIPDRDENNGIVAARKTEAAMSHLFGKPLKSQE